jgi:hypothetical protein
MAAHRIQARFVQVSVAAAQDAGRVFIIALDEDGNVWDWHADLGGVNPRWIPLTGERELPSSKDGE